MGEHPPKKTLKEHAVTLGRRLKAVRGAIEYTGLHMKEGEAAEREVQKGGMVPLYHSIGRGIKFLDAAWEDWRAKRLDSPASAELVAKRRAALDARKTKLDADGEELESDAQAWHVATKAKIAEMNVALGEIGRLHINEQYRTTEDLLDDIREMRLYINELRRGHVHPDDLMVSDDKIPLYLEQYQREDKASTALRALENYLAPSWSSIVERQGKLHKESRILERDERNAGTPEARIAKREALLDDRDALYTSLHQAQLERIRIRRHISEKAADIRELWSGRDPLFAREERQTTDLQGLLVRLKEIRVRALPFEDFDSIAIHSQEILHPETPGEGAPKATTARRPIALEVEKLVEGRTMSERIRRAIRRVLPDRYEPVYYDHIRVVENIIEQAIAEIGITKP